MPIARRVLVVAGAIMIAVAGVLWFTAAGVGDPELCYEVSDSGDSEICPTKP